MPPKGKPVVLVEIPAWDYKWQETYWFQEPIQAKAGTKLEIDAVFDNSADNPLNPDPAAAVRFGEKTTDEMMVGFIHYSFVDKAQQVDMPTFSVPEKMRQQMDQLQEFRRQQKEKAAAESTTSSGGR